MTVVRNFVLFVFCHFSLQAEFQASVILPPQNLSLVWMSDFEPMLTWTSLQPSVADCSYYLSSKTNEPDDDRYDKIKEPLWKDFTVMEGGFLNFAVQTVCNHNLSEPTVLNVTFPEPVMNVKCHLYSSKEAHCSWELGIPTPDFKFFYRLQNENFSVNDGSPLLPLQECPLYTDKNGLRTGCNLPANVIHGAHLLFNGTANGTFFRNTFRRRLREDVRLPPLNLTVKKTGGKFNITWTPPLINEGFKYYTINYRECNTVMTLHIEDIHRTWTELEVVPYCQYRMTVEALHTKFSTPPSDEQYFDAESDHNALVYAAVMVPLIITVLASLVFVFFRKNKDRILPKIPQPRDFLTGMPDMDKNCNFYIPSQGQENCKIALVVDPQMKNLEC